MADCNRCGKDFKAAWMGKGRTTCVSCQAFPRYKGGDQGTRGGRFGWRDRFTRREQATGGPLPHAVQREYDRQERERERADLAARLAAANASLDEIRAARAKAAKITAQLREEREEAEARARKVAVGHARPDREAERRAWRDTDEDEDAA